MQWGKKSWCRPVLSNKFITKFQSIAGMPRSEMYICNTGLHYISATNLIDVYITQMSTLRITLAALICITSGKKLDLPTRIWMLQCSTENKSLAGQFPAESHWCDLIIEELTLIQPETQGNAVSWEYRFLWAYVFYEFLENIGWLYKAGYKYERSSVSFDHTNITFTFGCSFLAIFFCFL